MECVLVNSFQWLRNALADPEITDICINGTQSVFVDRGMGLETLPLLGGPMYTEPLLRDWILGELAKVGKTWDAKYPFVDATLESGHRIHIAFPSLTRQGHLISLRRLPQPYANQYKGEFHRWSQSPFYPPLANAIRRGDSILISGATGSGKTTLAGDLLQEVPSQERIIALEDTPELSPSHPHFLTLLSRPPNSDGFGEITLRTLLKQTLRMRPDRVVLGECRGAEVLELLQALNTGHRGALATLHANSPRDALRRIELLCILSAGRSLPVTGIRELLSVGIQWIAQVKREGGTRKITELCKIEGREGDTILTRTMLECHLS